jgi:hypothetical protein
MWGEANRKVLREMGIEPDIEIVDSCIKKPVASIDELVDEWVKYRLMGKKVTETCAFNKQL